nr:MAG TPA: hypothetical protein [Caudoviricetes sp.]
MKEMGLLYFRPLSSPQLPRLAENYATSTPHRTLKQLTSTDTCGAPASRGYNSRFEDRPHARTRLPTRTHIQDRGTPSWLPHPQERSEPQSGHTRPDHHIRIQVGRTRGQEKRRCCSPTEPGSFHRQAR